VAASIVSIAPMKKLLVVAVLVLLSVVAVKKVRGMLV
jgi:hypothetical protein